MCTGKSKKKQRDHENICRFPDKKRNSVSSASSRSDTEESEPRLRNERDKYFPSFSTISKPSKISFSKNILLDKGKVRGRRDKLEF